MPRCYRPPRTTPVVGYRAPVGHEQYFAGEPTVVSAPTVTRLDLADLTLSLTTDRGVFSAGHVDPGTKLLLMSVPPPPTGAVNLVDLGCGYGPVAVTMARRAPDATVWAVDVNRRALELCARNAADNGCPNVRAVTPDEVPEDLQVDAIWSNPPIRIGKAALHELLDHWLGRLAPQARAWFVVQKHLGADSLARWLDETGWPTQRLVARQSFRVLEVTAGEHARID